MIEKRKSRCPKCHIEDDVIHHHVDGKLCRERQLDQATVRAGLYHDALAKETREKYDALERIDELKADVKDLTELLSEKDKPLERALAEAKERIAELKHLDAEIDKLDKFIHETGDDRGAVDAAIDRIVELESEKELNNGTKM